MTMHLPDGIADIPKVTEINDSDWVATCGVCEGNFVIHEDGSDKNPYPHGSFCPDCRAKRLMAPGVLNWHRRLSIQS